MRSKYSIVFPSILMLPPLNLSNSNSLGLFLCFIHTNLSLCLWNYYFSNVKLIVLYQTRPQQKKRRNSIERTFHGGDGGGTEDNKLPTLYRPELKTDFLVFVALHFMAYLQSESEARSISTTLQPLMARHVRKKRKFCA